VENKKLSEMNKCLRRFSQPVWVQAAEAAASCTVRAALGLGSLFFFGSVETKVRRPS
jgi:hypothetical protein